VFPLQLDLLRMFVSWMLSRFLPIWMFLGYLWKKWFFPAYRTEAGLVAVRFSYIWLGFFQMEGYCLAGIFRERKESGRACIYRNGCTESELSRNTASERGAFSSEIRNSQYHILD